MSNANTNPSAATPDDASANPDVPNLHPVGSENACLYPVPGRGLARDTQAPHGARPDSKVAVYWDFENVHRHVMNHREGPDAYQDALRKRAPQRSLVDIDPVVEYAATFGRVVVHRAYGNWRRYGCYNSKLQAHAVEMVQVFPLNGFKNAADIRLALDVAEDLHWYPHVTHVVVVGSDTDYTPLAQWCRRQGRFFIGVGMISTPRLRSSYETACDKFLLYEDLARTVQAGKPSDGSSPTAA